MTYLEDDQHWRGLVDEDRDLSGGGYEPESLDLQQPIAASEAIASPVMNDPVPTVATDSVMTGNQEVNGRDANEWSGLAKQGVAQGFTYLLAKDAALSGVTRSGASTSYRGADGRIYSSSGSTRNLAQSSAGSGGTVTLALLAGLAYLALG